MAELADSVLLSRSGMTRLVDRLEKDRLLERDTCTDDGRGCYAVLTDKGAELLAHGPPDAPGGRARAVPAALLRGRDAAAGGAVGARAPRFRRTRRVELPVMAEGRERILDTAYELFSKHGTRAVGVDRDHRRGGRGEDDAVPQLRLQGRADRRLPRRPRGALDARLAAAGGRAPRERACGAAAGDLRRLRRVVRAARLRGLLVHQRDARADRPRGPRPGRERQAPERDPRVPRRAGGGRRRRGPRGVRAPVAHPDEGLDRRRRRGRRPGRARAQDMGRLLLASHGLH